MEIDQRGESKDYGLCLNLLIDEILLNGTRRYTLPKEELTVQLGGLEGTLEIHGIHLKYVMKTWRITLEIDTS